MALSLRDSFLISRDMVKNLVFEARKAPSGTEVGDWIRGGVRVALSEYRATRRAYRDFRVSTSAPANPWVSE